MQRKPVAMSFSSLEFPSTILNVLDSLALQQPTPVQRELAPIMALRQDALVASRTGSGKTLAYLLPLLSRWASGNADNPGEGPESGHSRNTTLVVVPTRELTRQLICVLEPFLQALTGFKAVELAGGASINPQLMKLRGGADLIVATPGRLLDVIEHNGLDPRCVDVLILDEADRLLDDGFQDELDTLMSKVRPNQTVMLSATFTPAVRAKAKWVLNDPALLDVSEPVAELHQRVIQVDHQRRAELLESLIRDGLETPALVFTADRKGAERLARKLSERAMQAAVLHGRLSTAQRHGVLHRLGNDQLQVLVATDLAARGIDVPQLPVVVNYDLPRSPELYTHRIGRSGRAGVSGEAISLVDVNTEAHMRLIEKRMGRKVLREQLPGFEPQNKAHSPSPLNDGNGGIKGRRMSKKDKLRAASAKVKQRGSGYTP